ncbi:MAG: hypothetical protein HY722_08730, partial [Planctomycetes bacterium]|nr:hypothetical protein [Planctomycetota bacterium]
AAPAPVAVAPASAMPGQELQLHVGGGLDPVLTRHTVLVDGVAAPLNTVYGGGPLGYDPATGSGMIRFTVPASLVAGRTVNLTIAAGGAASAPVSLALVAAPELISLSPTSAQPGDTLEIQCRGAEIFQLHQVKGIFAGTAGPLTVQATGGGASAGDPITTVRVSVPRGAISGPLAVESLGVRSANTLNLTVPGSAPSAPAPAWGPAAAPGTVLQLQQGPNRVTWQGPTGADVAAATAPIQGVLQSVWRFDPGTGLWGDVYFPGAPALAGISPLTTLANGDSLAVTVSAAVAWRVP